MVMGKSVAGHPAHVCCDNTRYYRYRHVLVSHARTKSAHIGFGFRY